MPELPEVETVRQGLLKLVAENASISSLWLSPYNLRFPYTEQMQKTVLNKTILDINRRAKYLLFDLGDYILISHLGMSGTWREGGRNRKHDHIELNLSSGQSFTYNDPRRFGFLLLTEKKKWKENKFIKNLGPEPLEKDFSSDYLFNLSRKKTAPIKNFIMKQEVVVGVGNIYASEALFLSGIRPTKRAGKIKKIEAERLVRNIKHILKKAIQAGGCYIRDFQNLEGASSFQRQLYVYGQNEKACKKCGTKIKKIIQVGRSSFYCPKCQS